MDTLGAVALSTDRPDREMLEKKPAGRNAPLITPTMWRFIIGHTIFQCTVLIAFLVVFKNASANRGNGENNTFFFNYATGSIFIRHF